MVDNDIFIGHDGRTYRWKRTNDVYDLQVWYYSGKCFGNLWTHTSLHEEDVDVATDKLKEIQAEEEENKWLQINTYYRISIDGKIVQYRLNSGEWEGTQGGNPANLIKETFNKTMGFLFPEPK